MTKSGRACPSATIAAPMSAATSFSVRPGRSHSPIRRCTRSMAAPAAASASTSAAPLRIRSSAIASPARVSSEPGTIALAFSACTAGMW